MSATVPPPSAPLDLARFSRAGLGASLILGVWYLATMGRGLAWFDAGELALVGETLGVGHPPGQPGYTLLCWLMAQGPWPALVGLNLLSALSAAACALPFDWALRRFVPDLGSPARLLVLLVAGVAAPVWDQATRIELYAPATLLFALAVNLATAHADGPARRWWAPGLVVGALATVNALFAIMAALGAAACALRGGRWHQPARVATRGIVAATAAIFGLVPYLQPWLAARAGDRFVWGDWTSSAGVWDALTGADYAHTAHAAWDLVPAHALDWLAFLGLQGCLAATLLGLVGLGTAAGRRLAPLWVPALILGVAFTLTYGTYHAEVPDYNGYFMPLLWCAALGLGALARQLRPQLGWAMAGVLLVSGLATGERPFWQRSRADLAPAALGLAEAWLDATPPGGVLILESDHLVFPALYAQRVRHHRPDVVLINLGFASSGWFWADLFRQHPDLPPFDLRAPSREARLQRFLATQPQRSVRVEHLSLALAMGRKPCLDTAGLRLAPGCEGVVDDAARAHALIGRLHTGALVADPITPRVAAHLAFARAETAWALGEVSAAVAALDAGLPPDSNRLVPFSLVAVPGLRPLQRPGTTLIGDPRHLRALGAAALEALGQPQAAATWRVSP